MHDLDKVLNVVGKNKSRYPDGLNKSIYHPNCIGNNLKESLLINFNKLKRHGIIPSFMKKAIISTIPKSGSKYLLKKTKEEYLYSVLLVLFSRDYHTTQNMKHSTQICQIVMSLEGRK